MFRIGEVIKCNDDSKGLVSGIKALEKGETYIVVSKQIAANGKNEIEVDLKGTGFWNSSRFISLELDYEFVERIIREISEGISTDLKQL